MRFSMLVSFLLGVIISLPLHTQIVAEQDGYWPPNNRNVKNMPDGLLDYALCEGMLFRPTYYLPSVLQALRSHRFDFPFWDPIHDNITISRTVDLTGQDSDLMSVALDVCEEYTRGELGEIDETARLRCLSPTLLTLRLTKVHGMSLLSRQYELYPYDEELYGLLVGYEGLSDSSFAANLSVKIDGNGRLTDNLKSTTKSNKPLPSNLTSCIIGYPSIHSILPALFTKHIKHIIVYSSLIDSQYDFNSDPYNQAERLHGEYFTSNYDMNEIANMLDKTVEYHSLEALVGVSMSMSMSSNGPPLTHSQCSIIQIQDDEREFRHNLVDYLSSILDYLSDNRSIPIIRLQILHPTRAKSLPNPYSPWSKLLESRTLDFKLTISTLSSQILIPGTMYTSKESYWLCITSDDPLTQSFLIKTVYSDSEKHYTLFSEFGDRLSVIEIGDYHPTPPSATTAVEDSRGVDAHTTDGDQPNRVIIVITWSHPIFVDNAFGLAESIVEYLSTIDVGVDIDVYIAVEMSISMYDYLHDKSVLLIHIPVSTVDDMTVFAKYSVIYNSEHPSFEKVFGDSGIMRYFYLFHYKPTVMWSYNELSTDYLRNNVFLNTTNSKELMQRISTVSYLYPRNRKDVLNRLFNHKEYIELAANHYPNPVTRINASSTIHQSIPYRMHHLNPLHALYSTTEGSTEMVRLFNQTFLDDLYEDEISSYAHHHIGIFLGTCSQRRRDLLKKLEYLFMIDVIDGAGVPPLLLFYSICERVFNYHQDYYLLRSKVIVNIASSNVSTFETHRINYLLSLGKVVASEAGANASMANEYIEGVMVIPMPEVHNLETLSLDEAEDKSIEQQANVLFRTLKIVLGNDTLLQYCSQMGQALYAQRIVPNNKAKLHNALDSTLSYFIGFK